MSRPSLMRGHGYDFDDRLITQSVNGVGTGFTYDAEGELTASGSTTKSFDANGNPSADTILTNQIIYDGTYTYTYDDAGERTSKYDSTRNGPTPTTTPAS